MGSDDLYKKRSHEKASRKKEHKKVAPYRYLIVCEGEKTEPKYFNALKNRIEAVHKNPVVTVDIAGIGKNTESLVQHTIKLRQQAPVPYGSDNVWCVFDKDSFTDDQFNKAIQLAEKNGIKVAWSNESFELWFLLHFIYFDTALSRELYIDKLDDLFKQHGINKGKYEKNMENSLEILETHGSIDRAIQHATQLSKKFRGKKYAKYNPSTRVHLLLKELIKLSK